MKLVAPFIEGFMPKYPEIRTKQFTPIIEKLSIRTLHVVFIDERS
jgi:hypothetical protein